MAFYIKNITTNLFDNYIDLSFPEKYSNVFGPKFSIFLGKNGSGKSLIFRQITKLFNDGNLNACQLTYATKEHMFNKYTYKEGIKLIAVTASMSDKYIFLSKNKNYNGRTHESCFG